MGRPTVHTGAHGQMSPWQRMVAAAKCGKRTSFAGWPRCRRRLRRATGGTAASTPPPARTTPAVCTPSTHEPSERLYPRLLVQPSSTSARCCSSRVFDRPLVSVILPIHNGEQWTDSCLEGLLRQRCAPVPRRAQPRHRAAALLELSAYDDGSTDATWARLQEWRLDARLRMARRPRTERPRLWWRLRLLEEPCCCAVVGPLALLSGRG